MNAKNEKLLKNVFKRAEGYVQTETSTEYVIDEDGTKRAVKKRVVEKEIPPDVTALKMYIEMTENELKNMTDEELALEKERLIGLLKQKA